MKKSFTVAAVHMVEMASWPLGKSEFNQPLATTTQMRISRAGSVNLLVLKRCIALFIGLEVVVILL